MTDDDQRAAVLAEEAEQPVAGVVVQMVGRFVEQQQVAAGKEDASQLDSAALAAREDADRKVETVPTETEAGREAAHLGLGRVAAGVLELIVGACP